MADFVEDSETADRMVRETEKEIDELGLTNAEFEAFERDFQIVLQELAGDKTLERFRFEYEKLHKTLRTSHETEKRLIKRCKEINSDIAANVVKVQVALKLSQDDTHAMTQIKQDVDRTWKLVDQTREKEEELKKRRTELKQEVADLTRRIETDDTAPVHQQDLLNRLAREKDLVLAEKSSKVEKLKELRDKNTDLMKRKNDLEDAKQQLITDIHTLKEGISQANSEASQEETRKKETEKQLEELKRAYEKTQEEIKKKEAMKIQMKEGINELMRKNEALKSKKMEENEKIKNAENYNEKIDEGLRYLKELHQSLIAEAQAKEAETRKRKEEFSEMESDHERASKEITVMQKKVKQITEERYDLEQEKDLAKFKLQEMLKSNTELRRYNEALRKKIEEKMRDIHKMNKETIGFEGLTRGHNDELLMKKNELKKITNEVKGSKNEAAKVQALIAQLERDREKYALEASNAYSKYFQCLEQVKYKNSMIAKCQKDNQDAEAKLKQQQNLYEAVRSDRNIYSKALLESNEEIDELRRKYKILQHQTTKLREEISVKNNMIRDQRLQHNNLQEENNTNEQKKKNLENRKKQFEDYIKNYEGQISKLKYYIAEAEQERLKQKKEYEMVINDRDILGTQLIKRNEELASLYERIKIQQSTLAKGEVQYQEKVIEGSILKQKISELMKELFTSKSQISCISDLKREVYLLKRELMEARTKVKALDDELQNPMNVHRYRKLEGTNPETYEMIKKIQTLQRRLIAKTEEVAEKDFLIQEKERLYIELKNILARQPGAEVSEQLVLYQENIKEKSKQMKKMVAELNSYHTQVESLKFEIERLSSELRGLKEGWFKQQRKQRNSESMNKASIE